MAQSTTISDDEAQVPFEHILYPRDPIHQHAGHLARFLAELDYEDIPGDVLHAAKRLTLDTLGCIVAGSHTSLGRDILAAYGRGGAETGCRIPGTPLRLPPSLAAKVNAWLSDVLDYEDVASGHPSATVIPAALATAEHFGASPRQFLAGVVAGYEAGLRVHDATKASPEVYRRFAVYHAWHGIAAGAAAIVVAGGSEEQVRSALGHSAANTNLPIWYVQYGRPAHALKANYGQMALGGVDAALCARRNIVGPFAMLSDAKRGFAWIIGSDNFDPQELSAGLSERWRTREASFKAFPCCAFLHSTIDAVSKIMSQQTVDLRNIERISIRSFSRIETWFSDTAPASEIDAQLSVQYVTAMALLSRPAGREWYLPAVMTDAVVSELMQKMQVETDPVAEQAFWESRQYKSSVTLHMKDGRKLNAAVDWPPGHWRRPFSDADVEDKFMRNVHDTPLEPRGDEIVDLIMNIDRWSSLDKLLRLFST